MSYIHEGLLYAKNGLAKRSNLREGEGGRTQKRRAVESLAPQAITSVAEPLAAGTPKASHVELFATSVMRTTSRQSESYTRLACRFRRARFRRVSPSTRDRPLE